MPLTTCPDCGHAVSSQAAACPSCGRPSQFGALNPRPVAEQRLGERVVRGLVVGVVLAAVIGYVLGWWR